MKEHLLIRSIAATLPLPLSSLHVRQRVNANNSIPLVPWVAPVVQPFADSRRQPLSRGAMSGIKDTLTLLISENDKGQTKKLLFL